MIALGTRLTIRFSHVEVPGVLGRDDDGVYTLTDDGGAVHRLVSDAMVIERAIVRTAAQIAEARDLAAHATADALDPTARTELLGYDVARDVPTTRRGAVSCARYLVELGLITYVTTTPAGLHYWRITPDGQAVAKVIRLQRWSANQEGRLAS